MKSMCVSARFPGSDVFDAVVAVSASLYSKQTNIPVEDYWLDGRHTMIIFEKSKAESSLNAAHAAANDTYQAILVSDSPPNETRHIVALPPSPSPTPCLSCAILSFTSILY